MSCSFGDLVSTGSCSVTVSSATQATQTGDCVAPPGLTNQACVSATDVTPAVCATATPELRCGRSLPDTGLLGDACLRHPRPSRSHHLRKAGPERTQIIQPHATRVERGHGQGRPLLHYDLRRANQQHQVPSQSSALEAICVSPSIGPNLPLQVARQLTALALNCAVTSGGADPDVCAGTPFKDVFDA